MDKRQTIKTAAIGLLAGVFASRSGAANETQTGASDRFPGDPPEHRLVYQVNHAQADYIDHIINSLRAMIVKYGDNVALAVVAFGPGLHLLATQPERPISEEARARIAGMAKDYGVELVACGNTMKALGWGPDRIIAASRIEEVGAAALMTYQEKGYAYIAW